MHARFWAGRQGGRGRRFDSGLARPFRPKLIHRCGSERVLEQVVLGNVVVVECVQQVATDDDARQQHGVPASKDHVSAMFGYVWTRVS